MANHLGLWNLGPRFESERDYMIRTEFEKDCTLPAMNNPHTIMWQIKKMKNTTTDEYIVNSGKRAHREFKVDGDMNLYERSRVHESVYDAKYSTASEPEIKWVESDICFEGILIGQKDRFLYKYEVTAHNGTLETVNLISKTSK